MKFPFTEESLLLFRLLLLFNKIHDFMEEYDELEELDDDDDGDDVELKDFWFSEELTMFVGTNHLSYLFIKK